ncbi:hypothetical protein N7E81_16515 [Reichenbachiella carrageenanivorans]|uniref:PorV/PorQ family protein n=1 Tax=Reichenbachiella carrageenanivorans TaxID=2979869 RepID=A0ABY6D1L5_9BACT|nr:hypothetical protein [Reichenbachiella carrageenanivorans]UXX78958.1 hypothetical protein N7E81_16515 [Reichenbachiella carrageenanivorans]
MIRLLAFGLFCLIIDLSAHAQNGNYGMGARSAAIGGSSITIGDEWSLFNNIGGLANFDKKAIFTSFKNKYGISEVTSLALGATYPIAGGTAGLGVFKFGDDLYNEQRVNLGFSNQFGIVSLGLNVSYYQLSIEGSGSRKTMMIDFGGRAKLTDQLYFGAHVSNLNQAKLSTVTDERISTIMKTGLSYRPSLDLMINAEVEKIVDQDAVLKIGLEYQILEQLSLRTGFHTHPFESSFGLGFRPGKLKADYAYNNNPDLGGIHEISLGYSFGE